MKPLVVLSLFDGISAGQLALQRAGIAVKRYYASEMDPAAIAITQHHFPETIQIGDVRGVWAEQFDEPVDLVIGGPPCQDLSAASHTKSGIYGDRSILFFEFARLLKTLKPKWWLMENVASMGKANMNAISATLGTDPVKQNAALVSAQNRNRLWWANFSWDEPEDRGILLKDILEPVLGGYVDRDKSYAWVGRDSVRGGTIAMYLQRRRRQIVWKDQQCHQVAVAAMNGNDNCKRVYGDDGKCPTVPTGGSGNTMPKVLVSPYRANRVYDAEGKSPTIVANETGGLKTPKVLVGGNEMRSRVFAGDGKCPTILTCEKSGNVPKLHWKQDMWRELSITEIERCFTFPDGYTDIDGLSATKRKRCLGNSWVVDAVVAILDGMKRGGGCMPQLRLVMGGHGR